MDLVETVKKELLKRGFLPDLVREVRKTSDHHIAEIDGYIKMIEEHPGMSNAVRESIELYIERLPKSWELVSKYGDVDLVEFKYEDVNLIEELKKKRQELKDLFYDQKS